MKTASSSTGNQPDKWQLHDVIVAVSTPTGRSTRAVVRVSGAGALAILRALERGSVQRNRGMWRVRLHFAFGLLPAIAVVMPGPGSYTGEDSFELLLPGNPHLVEMVVSEMVGANANVRRAGPGEFSLRSFLNGRLTLEQAEGVAATISARTDAQLRAATCLRMGTLGQIATRLLESIADMLALVEAGIDFTDQEDVVAIPPGALCAGLRAGLQQVNDILNCNIAMEQLDAAPWVVLTGNPNAGKSALMNALLQQDRAIVNSQAGTTRDALVEPWSIPVAGGQAEVLLVDSPGFIGGKGQSESPGESTQFQRLKDEQDNAQFDREKALLDQLGQEARSNAIQRATILLRCHAADAGPAPVAGENEIIVLTKCDVVVKPAVDGSAGIRGGGCAGRVVHTSAKQKTGLNELAQAVSEALSKTGISSAGESMALAQRHRALFAAGARDIQQALSAAEANEFDRHLSHPELVAGALHGAIEHLGAIAGRMTPEDILGRIFSRFCVGK